MIPWAFRFVIANVGRLLRNGTRFDKGILQTYLRQSIGLGVVAERIFHASTPRSLFVDEVASPTVGCAIQVLT